MALLEDIIHDYKVNGNTEALADLFENEKVKKLINDISRWYKYNKQDVISVIKVHIIDYLKNSYEYNDKFNEKIFLDTMKSKVSYATKKEVSRTQKSKEVPFGDPDVVFGMIEGNKPDDFDSIDEHVDLIASLGHLTPEERQIVQLKFWEDMTDQEIAETIGKSRSTVISMKKRALEKMRRMMS